MVTRRFKFLKVTSASQIGYDKCNEVHEVVDNKLDKFGITLNNKFSLLKDELSSLSDKIGKSVQELTKLDNQIKGSMNQEFEKYSESMVATLDDRLSKSETSGTNDKSNLPTKSFSQTANTIVKEQREKEKRQTNLIFHNIPESASKEPQTRKQHDINKITRLTDKCINVKCSVKNASRIGEKGQSGKPRLLKVTLTNVEDKVAVLCNKSLLQREGVPEFARNVYKTPDLTPA